MFSYLLCMKKVIFDLKLFWPVAPCVGRGKVTCTPAQAAGEGLCPVLHSFNAILTPSEILGNEVIIYSILFFTVRWD